MWQVARTRRRTSVWVRAASCFARWQGGESAALDELVKLMTPVLWHTVRAYGLSQAAAEDAVQNTWLALVRSGHRSARRPRSADGC